MGNCTSVTDVGDTVMLLGKNGKGNMKSSFREAASSARVQESTDGIALKSSGGEEEVKREERPEDSPTDNVITFNVTEEQSSNLKESNGKRRSYKRDSASVANSSSELFTQRKSSLKNPDPIVVPVDIDGTAAETSSPPQESADESVNRQTNLASVSIPHEVEKINLEETSTTNTINSDVTASEDKSILSIETMQKGNNSVVTIDLEPMSQAITESIPQQSTKNEDNTERRPSLKKILSNLFNLSSSDTTQSQEEAKVTANPPSRRPSLLSKTEVEQSMTTPLMSNSKNDDDKDGSSTSVNQGSGLPPLAPINNPKVERRRSSPKEILMSTQQVKSDVVEEIEIPKSALYSSVQIKNEEIEIPMPSKEQPELKERSNQNEDVVPQAKAASVPVVAEIAIETVKSGAKQESQGKSKAVSMDVNKTENSNATTSLAAPVQPVETAKESKATSFVHAYIKKLEQATRSTPSSKTPVKKDAKVGKADTKTPAPVETAVPTETKSSGQAPIALNSPTSKGEAVAGIKSVQSKVEEKSTQAETTKETKFAIETGASVNSTTSKIELKTEVKHSEVNAAKANQPKLVTPTETQPATRPQSPLNATTLKVETVTEVKSVKVKTEEEAPQAKTETLHSRINVTGNDSKQVKPSIESSASIGTISTPSPIDKSSHQTQNSCNTKTSGKEVGEADPEKNKKQEEVQKQVDSKPITEQANHVTSTSSTATGGKTVETVHKPNLETTTKTAVTIPETTKAAPVKSTVDIEPNTPRKALPEAPMEKVAKSTVPPAISLSAAVEYAQPLKSFDESPAKPSQDLPTPSITPTVDVTRAPAASRRVSLYEQQVQVKKASVIVSSLPEPGKLDSPSPSKVPAAETSTPSATTEEPRKTSQIVVDPQSRRESVSPARRFSVMGKFLRERTSHLH